ncbi:Succinate dehydrogenase assembly factor 2 [Fasciola gigantica]|uniref:Succinate dehydrogenase assembly factor 2 n=1 Tax=Fasciola gigantica TaxID=46835 RepID=A0A504Z0D1_FASGI|nr:Succinate dehydrogenase assembly factor 2 [Fasciola gigantica]
MVLRVLFFVVYSVFSTFADEFLDRLNSKQLAAYDSLINQPDNDWDIYYWATGAKEAPEFFRTDVLKMLQEHAKNEGKTLRNQQPPLKPRSN